MREIILEQRHAVDPDLLVPPSQRTFGDEPDIEVDRLRLRIGDRPMARNLRTLYELSDRELPESLEVFFSYNLWLLTHVFSVIKEGGYKRVRMLGYRMRFPEKPKITVVGRPANDPGSAYTASCKEIKVPGTIARHGHNL